MSLKVQSHTTFALRVARLHHSTGRDVRSIAAHPTLNNLSHLRTETLIHHTLINSASFLGRHLNLQG